MTEFAEWPANKTEAFKNNQIELARMVIRRATILHTNIIVRLAHGA